jgi:hypothetical protein
MPFDGPPPREMPRRERRGPSDTAVTALIVVVCGLLLGTPISLAAFGDLVAYLGRR